MHQFKEKSAREQELVRASLFLYPVLQAADILLYKTDEVPVGDDQRQHIELAREIARRFNSTYGDVLVEPEHVIPEVGARIMDLQDPARRCRPATAPRPGLIYIDDEPDDIRKKLKRAETDSGREVVRAPDKPGITNLIEILAVARGVAPEQVEREFEGQGYGAFKQAVAEDVVELLEPGARALPRAAPGRGRPRAHARRGRRARPRDRPPVMAEVRDAMGIGPAAGSVEPAARLPADVAGARSTSTWRSSTGPFDLLLTLVLREEIDLLEVDLAEVVLAYVEHLERAGELDLEAATEFLVLIAALLELKSRLMLPQEDEEGLDLEPQEAAEELLARMLEYHRYRGAAQHLRERLEAEHGYRYRSAPLPPELRRVSLEAAEPAYDPQRWPRRSAGCCECRRRSTCATCAARPCRSSSACATCASCSRAGSRFSFDDAVKGADRLTEAVTLFALLELYKAGEANWEQEGPFGPITVVRT